MLGAQGLIYFVLFCIIKAERLPLDLIENKSIQELVRISQEFYNLHFGQNAYFVYDVRKITISNNAYEPFLMSVIYVSSNCHKSFALSGSNYMTIAKLRDARNICQVDMKDFKICSFSSSAYPVFLNGRGFLKFSSCSSVNPDVPQNPEFSGFKVPDNAHELFVKFKSEYRKMYSIADEKSKFQTFKDNLIKAQMLQALDQGTAEYGVTPFSDLTELEFSETRLKMWNNGNNSNRTHVTFSQDTPAHFDWRDKKAVTEIKNQKSCGSCWAFSTTGNIETQWYLKTGKLLSLSEQQLVDCDSTDSGCNGGLPSNAYKAIIQMGGLMTEEAYPYDAKNEKCHLVRKDTAVYINDSVTLPTDESELASWLFKNGTISAGLNANLLQFYRHGISHPWHILCPKFMLNHAVLLVGYGVEKGKPFWIVKNSWGTGWGENGYFRMYRGDETCGINTVCTSAVIL